MLAWSHAPPTVVLSRRSSDSGPSHTAAPLALALALALRVYVSTCLRVYAWRR